MDITTIKKALFKQGTVFKTGGLRPTSKIGESWIGKVSWGKEGDSTPVGFAPLCTLFLEKLPYVPQVLSGYPLLTIYMNFKVFDHLVMDNLVSFFKINCYEDLDYLKKMNEQSEKIKPFPLTPLLIENDTPSLEDTCSFTLEIEEEILWLESEEDLDYYEDIAEEIYSSHKVGGYPSFIQGGNYVDGDYHFVFQISSDEKARFNIVDGGSFYFFYNREKQDWIVNCDFY